MTTRNLQRLAVVVAVLSFPAAADAAFNFNVQTNGPINVAGVTLNGDDQSKTFTMTVAINNDGAGNTTGWNLNAAATSLTTTGGYTLLPLQVTGVTYSQCTGSCNNPQNSITWPVTLSTTAQKIFNAAVNTGLGDTTLTPTFKLTYPANAVSGAYTGTVTLSASIGP